MSRKDSWNRKAVGEAESVSITKYMGNSNGPKHGVCVCKIPFMAPPSLSLCSLLGIACSILSWQGHLLPLFPVFLSLTPYCISFLFSSHWRASPRPPTFIYSLQLPKPSQHISTWRPHLNSATTFAAHYNKPFQILSLYCPIFFRIPSLILPCWDKHFQVQESPGSIWYCLLHHCNRMRLRTDPCCLPTPTSSLPYRCWSLIRCLDNWCNPFFTITLQSGSSRILFYIQ